MPLRFRLGDVLEEKQLSGYRLAQLMGMTPSAIYKLQDADRLNLSTLERLCEVLGVAPGELLVMEPAKKDKKKRG